MKRKLPILCLALIVCGLGSFALAARLRHAGEPHVRGHCLHYWTRTLTAHPIGKREIVREIGPTIVPHLLGEIGRYEAQGNDLLYRGALFLQKHAPNSLKPYTPEPVAQAERRLHAILLLGDLGPVARQAVPTLTRLLDDDSLSGSVVLTLGLIGADAKAAVPKLLTMLNDFEDPSPWVASTLAKIGASPTDVVPALRRASTNGPLWLRLEAAQALHQFGLIATLSKVPEGDDSRLARKNRVLATRGK